MDPNGLLNIYEQYYEAKLKYGFFIKEKTWKSIGQVMFIVGTDEGEPLKGNPPYYNNPKVFVRLFYTDCITNINALTKFRVIKIHDGGSYRYQGIDENMDLK